MRPLPLVPTALVALAVAVMIALGVWQLQRKAEKEALLARYADAQGLPPVAFGTAAPYRRSSATCAQVTGWRAASGRNVPGDGGWVHIASCRGPQGVFEAAMGWSERPEPPRWRGGEVEGVIGPGGRLVALNPAPGLQAAQPPSVDDVPNNHLFYAIQWFFFAVAAAVIYLLALRRQRR